MTVIIFLIVLAVLIFVHELGHFLAAKAFGIRVDAFKIGFGPKIISWRGRSKHVLKTGETEYGLNLIPFGGYVKIFGEDPDVEAISGPHAKRSFVNKKRWQQALVLFAGVAFNFIFAWALYCGAFMSGVTATTDGFERYAADFSNSRIMITNVAPDSPAEKAGLKMGDVITGLEIGGNKGAKIESVEDIQTTINTSEGKTISVQYMRGNGSGTIQVSPLKGIIADKYAIGIAMANVVDLRLSFIDSIVVGTNYTWVMVKETLIGLATFVANIFEGNANFSDVAGPVGIAGIVGNAAALGFTYLVMITALISINLGIINLIPFPALDGGRILFVAIEGISRRRIPSKFTNTVNTIGFALLILLMLAVTYKDVLKLVK